MNNLFQTIVKAGDAAAAGASGPGLLENLFPIILMAGVIYLFVIRPQKKQRQKHVLLVSALEKGTQVITNSGMLGTIYAVEERFFVLDIADKTRVRILKSHIANKYQEKEQS